MRTNGKFVDSVYVQEVKCDMLTDESVVFVPRVNQKAIRHLLNTLYVGKMRHFRQSANFPGFSKNIIRLACHKNTYQLEKSLAHI